jgi:hypothetical protein
MNTNNNNFTADYLAGLTAASRNTAISAMQNAYYPEQISKPASPANTLSLTYEMAEGMKNIILNPILMSFDARELTPNEVDLPVIFMKKLLRGNVTFSQLKIQTSEAVALILFSKSIHLTTFKTDGTTSVDIIKLGELASEFAYKSGILTLPLNVEISESTQISLDISGLSVYDTFALNWVISKQPGQF